MERNIDESFKKILQDKAKPNLFGKPDQTKPSIEDRGSINKSLFSSRLSPRDSLTSMFNFGRKDKSKMEDVLSQFGSAVIEIKHHRFLLIGNHLPYMKKMYTWS